MKIKQVLAREIFDSRGLPTIQCQIFLDNGAYVTSSVPSGIFKNSFEAVELRDKDKRLFGKGVLKAVNNIEKVIAPQIVGKEPNAVEMDLKMIELDGTINKSFLGANTMLAVSMALYRAEALAENIELYQFIAFVMGSEAVRIPYPLFNLIDGTKCADTSLNFQEFMIVPVGLPNFRSALESGSIIFNEFKDMLTNRLIPVTFGDQGGFSIGFKNDKEVLDLLLKLIEEVGAKYGIASVLAIDVGASHYYDAIRGLYKFNNSYLDTDQVIEYYQNLSENYPIYSIEDGLTESDVKGWAKLTEIFKNKVKIVADDIFATNIYKIAEGIHAKVANSVVIKPNQIGTVTESLQAIKLCHENGLDTIASHRSGETEDTFISDLAVGASCSQIKSGNCAGGRMAKYNRLLEIEDELMLNSFDT